MNDVILLTGATGLLGRYLLRDLALGGVRLAVLVRGDRRRSAAARIDAIVSGWEKTLGRTLPRPHILDGDLTTPGLGLANDDRRWFERHCRQVVHNGASLTFRGSDRRKDPWLTNLTGTAHVLEACQNAGVRSFHHVSTAYVCGTRTDVVTEDEFNWPAAFRNDYEASKAEAEQLVRAARFPEAVTVYRPAVIVGDSITGMTFTYHGLYVYMQFLWLLSRFSARGSDGRWHLPGRLTLTGTERQNLVPVDWVSAVMTAIILRPESHGRIYHLTPDPPVTAREVEEAMAAYFGYTGVTFAGPDALAAGDMNEEETLFYEYVSQYELYWAAEPRFDSSNTQAAVPDRPCPAIDARLVGRLIDFAIRDGWGRGRKKSSVAETMAAS